MVIDEMRNSSNLFVKQNTFKQDPELSITYENQEKSSGRSNRMSTDLNKSGEF
jgi:hypothetical protein